jgi:hypothetical protein
MNSFHFRERGGVKLPRLYTLPIYDYDLRATHARTLLPAALASVSFGFVLVRVRVRVRGGIPPRFAYAMANYGDISEVTPL